MNFDFNKLGGILPVVIQDWTTKDVLMLGFMNEEAATKTIETGRVHFYSRTRKRLWMKGEESGHRLLVKKILIDCDQDSLVILAQQEREGTCHHGYMSCFYRSYVDGQWPVIASPVFDPKTVYKK